MRIKIIAQLHPLTDNIFNSIIINSANGISSNVSTVTVSVSQFYEIKHTFIVLFRYPSVLLFLRNTWGLIIECQLLSLRSHGAVKNHVLNQCSETLNQHSPMNQN